MRDISFELSAGQSLLRFYDPDAERILDNGHDLRHDQQRSVRAAMGVVLQNGEVLERGRHADLAGRPGGLYARLSALQAHGRLQALAT